MTVAAPKTQGLERRPNSEVKTTATQSSRIGSSTQGLQRVQLKLSRRPVLGGHPASLDGAQKARGTGLATCKELKNGTQHAATSRGAGPRATTFTPCVVERKGTEKYTDAAPASALRGGHIGIRRQLSRSIPSSGEVVPLTSDKSSLIGRDRRAYHGRRHCRLFRHGLGLVYAVANWTSLWSFCSQGEPTARPTCGDAILMTDGEYNTQYDTNGVRSAPRWIPGEWHRRLRPSSCAKHEGEWEDPPSTQWVSATA